MPPADRLLFKPTRWFTGLKIMAYIMQYRMKKTTFSHTSNFSLNIISVILICTQFCPEKCCFHMSCISTLRHTFLVKKRITDNKLSVWAVQAVIE
jgi:hypothetical protein